MTRKTIYFHIGTTKTGSTSIQKFLTRNRQLLQGKGFALYTGQEADPADQLRVVRKNLVGVDVSFATRDPEAWVRTFMDRLEKRTEELIVLTEELVWFALFSMHKKEKFSSFITQLQRIADVKFIVYVRRQDEFFMSSYQECLKYGWASGRTCRQEVYQKNHRNMRYREPFEWMASLVGLKNIMVRPFETGQFYGGSLVQDFLHCVGLELTGEYEQETLRSNQGLSPFFSEILRCISFFKQGAGDYAALVRYAFDHPSICLNHSGGHQFLSPRERHQYLRGFEAGNCWVATELLGRADGILFDEPLPALDEPWVDYQIDPEEVRSFFEAADFLTDAKRKRLCRQVLSVCGGRKPLRLRIRDRSKVEVRRFLRKRGLNKWSRRIR
jgi:hypothetical protein